MATERERKPVILTEEVRAGVGNLKAAVDHFLYDGVQRPRSEVIGLEAALAWVNDQVARVDGERARKTANTKRGQSPEELEDRAGVNRARVQAMSIASVPPTATKPGRGSK